MGLDGNTNLYGPVARKHDEAVTGRQSRVVEQLRRGVIGRKFLLTDKGLLTLDLLSQFLVLDVLDSHRTTTHPYGL